MLGLGVSLHLTGSEQTALGPEGLGNVRVRFENPGQGWVVPKVRNRVEGSLSPSPATLNRISAAWVSSAAAELCPIFNHIIYFF